MEAEINVCNYVMWSSLFNFNLKQTKQPRLWSLGGVDHELVGLKRSNYCVYKKYACVLFIML